jgi:hypothetical protein
METINRSGAALQISAVKREEGATPSLSRNCKGGPLPHHATGETWEGAAEGRSPSQETCHSDAFGTSVERGAEAG